MSPVEGIATRTVLGTLGSMRDTLRHVVGAQEPFFAALTATGPVSVIRGSEPFPSLAAPSRTSRAALVELAAHAQAGATKATAYRGEGFTLPVCLLLVQAINHATEHRTQVAAILTHQGIEQPSMDGGNTSLGKALRDDTSPPSAG